MKYLHVVPRNYEVMREIVQFIRKYFDADEHYILFHTPCTGKYAEILSAKNVYDWRDMGKGKWGKYRGYKDFLEQADIVFLHGFYFRNSLLEFYATHPGLLKKCIWIGWGIDIYNWKRPEIGIKNRVLNGMDVLCRHNLYASGVLLETDTPVLKKNFGDTSKTYITPYPFQAHNFELMDELRKKPKRDDVIRIQLGNNSFRFNNQVEILDALRPFRDENILIIMPLTYGNAGHIEVGGHTQRLMRYAKSIFGDKVKFQTQSIKKDFYTKLLSSYDIGIFNAHRQNALGNIVRLAYMGKKVFLNSDNPLYHFLLEKGLEIYDVKDIPKMTYEEFISPVRYKEPPRWIREYYHPDMAARYWAAMFREIDAKMYHGGDLSKVPEIPGFEGITLNGTELVCAAETAKREEAAVLKGRDAGASVKLRRVTRGDLYNLMVWRMRPDITEHMMTDVKLTMDMQRAWFERLQTSGTEVRWIIWVDDVPVGSIHLLHIDHEKKEAELGVFIAEKAYRDFRRLLYIHWNVFDYVFSKTDINRLYGCIMEGNEGMIRFNIANGSQVEETRKDCVTKNGRSYDLTYVAITKDRWAEFKKTVQYDIYEVE